MPKTKKDGPQLLDSAMLLGSTVMFASEVSVTRAVLLEPWGQNNLVACL
jgi:hypothetical protein